MAKKVESNEDLLRQILLRLPPKPLLRFKSVSKRWLSLISNSKFCHSHTLHLYKSMKSSSHPFPSSLMLSPNNPTPSPPPLQIPIINIPLTTNSSFRHVKIPRMSVTVLQSSNGLLLVEGRPLEDVNNPKKQQHFVYNPTTNNYLAVNYPSSQFSSSVVGIFLSFEPLKSLHYNIVTIRIKDFSSLNASNLRNIDYIVNVYSSETGSWTSPGVSFTGPFDFNTVCCNGAVFWWSDTRESLKARYFDVEKLCFKKYLMPRKFMKDKVVKWFGESGGFIQVVLQSMVDLEIDVVELSEDRSEWSVRFHMKLDSLMEALPRLSMKDFALVDVYCVVREKLLVFVINGRFMACDFLDSGIRQLRSFNGFLRGESRSDVFHYYENLSAVAPDK